MTENDIPRVAHLERMIFTDPWSEKVYRETFAIEGVEYVVAIDRPDRDEAGGGETIVGAAGVRNIAGTGEITNVMVLPEYRQAGIATRMITDLLKRGRQLGAEEFTLEVRAGNETAIRLYEKLGFVSEGIRPKFYRNPEEDALIMWIRQDINNR